VKRSSFVARPRQAIADPLTTRRAGAGVAEDDLAAGADDADDGRRVLGRRRRGAFAHQTDLIDSNG
jgi:hypothetical protein